MSTSRTPARKLPVLDTVSDTYTLVFENLATIRRMALLPAGLGALAAFAAAMTLPSLADLEGAALQSGALDGAAFDPGSIGAAAAEGMATFMGAQMVSLLVQTVLSLLLGVAWLRFVLASGPAGRRPTASYGRGLAAYLIASLQVVGSGLAVLGLIAAGGPVIAYLTADSSDLPLLGWLALGLVGFVGTALVMLVMVRVSLVMPARAMGDTRLGFLEVFAATRGNFWRLLIGNLLVALPVAILIGIASAIAASLMPVSTLAWAIGQGVVGGLAVAACVAGLTFAALAYRKLVEPALEPL